MTGTGTVTGTVTGTPTTGVTTIALCTSCSRANDFEKCVLNRRRENRAPPQLVLLEEVTYRLDGGITINQEITMSVNKNACVTNVVRVTMTPVAVSIVSN